MSILLSDTHWRLDPKCLEEEGWVVEERGGGMVKLSGNNTGEGYRGREGVVGEGRRELIDQTIRMLLVTLLLFQGETITMYMHEHN